MEDPVGAVMQRNAGAELRVVDLRQAPTAHGREVRQHGTQDEARRPRLPAGNHRVTEEIHPAGPQFICMPPSTLRACPVMFLASSDTRKTTAWPMSSGVCSRRSGQLVWM